MPEDRLTVGVLSPLLAGAYFGLVLKGIARYAATIGGRVIAVQTRDAQLGGVLPFMPPPFSTPLAWEQVDGFITVTDAVADSYVARARAHGKPVVMISHDAPGLDCPEVLPDNRAGMGEAIRHLIGHGHTRIGFAGQMDRSPGDDVYERYEAYCETLRHNGLGADPELLFASPSSLEAGGDVVARALLDAGLPCTAIVAGNDLIAAGIIRSLKAAGVALPSQMAVVGFDDRDFAAGLSPALASVRLDFAEVGEVAARLLVDIVHGVTVPAGEHRVRTTFMPRESCGCQGLSLPARPGGQGGGAEEHLGADLAKLLTGAGEPETEQRSVARIADGIAHCCREALRTGSPHGNNLRTVAEQAYEAFPRTATTSAVLECTLGYRRELLEERGYSPERLVALDGCIFELAQALNAAEARKQIRVNRELQKSLAEEYYVSIALLRMGDRDATPKSLAWLAGTHAKTACLGLWAATPDDEEWAPAPMRVAGIFGPGLRERLAPGTTLSSAAFPPVAALTAEGCAPDDLVLVLPVRTSAHYWGILAVCGEAEADAWAGGDVYFQWTSLLGMTLDKEALLDDVRASEERYALAARAANDGLWDWDVATGIVFYSPRWKAMLGYCEAEVGTGPHEWFSRVHPDDREALDELVAACLRGEKTSLQLEHRIKAKDGTYRWALCRAITLRLPGRRAVRMVGSLTDISERKRLEDRLLHAALYDSLTGLPNRSLLMDRMDQAFARAKRTAGYQFAVLFVDLDGFKAVNDKLGHACGDLLLTKVAERLKRHLRANDTAVRYGGDEFAVLLDGVSGRARAQAIAQRLQARLSVGYEVEGHEVVVSATIGVAVSSAGYVSADEMIHDADVAMYEAKRDCRTGERALGPAASTRAQVMVGPRGA
jgi:diguanylate cyclase (GGDEF)-like protein/PAS domain S-box-containing protein